MWGLLKTVSLLKWSGRALHSVSSGLPLFLLCAGKWTVQQAAELSVPAPTIEAALDGRFLSGLKDQRVKAAKFFKTLGATQPTQQPVRSPTCPVLAHLPGSHMPRDYSRASRCLPWDCLCCGHAVKSSARVRHLGVLQGQRSDVARYLASSEALVQGAEA